jgi:chromosome segregation ATPase
MIDQTIINKWLDAKGDEALKKLLSSEPLTFEDDVVFCLVGQREEIRTLHGKIEKSEQRQDERMDMLEKRMDRFEKSINEQMDMFGERIDRFEAGINGRMDMFGERMDRFEAGINEQMGRFEKSINERLSLVEDQITDVKIELREVKAELSAMNRRFDDVRKDMIVQTRWTIAIVTLLTVVVKLVDIFVK